MPTTILTKQDDMLDQICRQRLGNEHGSFETVLAANRGLAAKGPVLAMAQLVIFPDAALAAPKPRAGSLNLWD